MSAKSKDLLIFQAKIRDPKTRHLWTNNFRSAAKPYEFFAIYRKLFPHKLSLNDFHGPAFPKHAHLLINNTVRKQATSPFREILWAIARSLTFAKELKSFVCIKEKFEVSILNDDYSSATDHLKKIEDDFGKSIWLYQNRIASAHISSNESEPSNVATKIFDEVKTNALLHPILHWTRKRIEGATLREKIRTELTENVESSFFQSYLLAKILEQTSSSEKAISALLFIDSQSSIIDHYTSLILVLQAAASDEIFNEEIAAYIKPQLRILYRETDDARLSGILIALGDIVDNTPSQSDPRAQAIEAYTAGHYQLCIDLANGVLSNSPLDSGIRLLSIKAAVALNQRPLDGEDIQGKLHENLFNVLSANEDFYRSVHALVLMADRFADHRWMLYFRVALWHEINAEEPKRSQTWMRDVYVRDGFITPFTAIALDTAHTEKLFNHLESSGKYPLTLALVKSTIDVNLFNSTSGDARRLRYQARESLALGNYEIASKLYFESAKSESRTAIRIRSLGGASLALALSGRFKDAIETLIEANLENPHAPTLLPIKELLSQISDADRWPDTISLGLLFNLANKLGYDDDLSKLRLSFERFCETNDISKPSHLADRSNEFGIKHVIEYIDSVWQPEVMRQTLLYADPAEIEEARIEAYQVLSKLDPAKSRIYMEELASRIKQQEIAKVTALVEQSKVYVDIDAIKRSLRAKLKGSYAQYKNTLNQSEKTNNELFNNVLRALGKIEDASGSRLFFNLQLLDGQDTPAQSDIQFSAIFGEIANEFLKGDHGLNAYLSTRVRHGKFVDALRKSVMDEHLVTARQDNGSYVGNTYWDSELIPFQNAPEVTEIFSKFSRNFDESLFIARDKQIQIHTYFGISQSNENTGGLFRYGFSQLERRLMQNYDVDFKEIDELIIKCVDSLWEKTDKNLVEVRNYISTTLRDELIGHFDMLTEEISQTFNRYPPSRLANAIARSRTATQQAIENVAAWFRRSEVYDRKDFEIDFPSQIAASMVNRTLSMPRQWNGPEYDIESPELKLPGRTLDSLVDIFYALFENSAKYAEQENIPIKVKITLSFLTGDFKCSVVSNGKPPTDDRLARLEELRQSLQTQESRRLAQSEGRSGFRKILLALSAPIYKSHTLTFEHQVEGDFVVNFSFKISDHI